jgi:L-2,4-diaminobutyrate decarboxylase
MSVYEMGPAAGAVEAAVVEWMTERVGWDAGAGGVLTHGGSLANLTALLAARASASPDAWTEGVDGTLAVLAPDSAHYSVKRSVAMLGLGERALIPLEVDDYEPHRARAARGRARARRRCRAAADCARGGRLRNQHRSPR